MVYGAPFHKTTQRQRNKRLPGTGYDALEFLTTGRGHRGDFVARIRAGIKHAAPVDREREATPAILFDSPTLPRGGRRRVYTVIRSVI